jgi:ubiquinone/menaquinone biosynthesis C-methylase UbiE
MRRVTMFVFVAAFSLCLGLAQPASAQLASRSAEEWIKTLESPQRIAGLKVDETLAALHLKPGDVVADIGAGSGIFEAPLAQAVSPRGKVYAVDIEQGLVDHITQRANELHLANVQGVLGKFTDPNLPARNVDLAFINDVLHHIQDRAAYLKNLAGYLNPSGRVAVIEFVPERGSHKAQPELQVTEEQGAAMMASAGLKAVEKIELFPDKWFVIYGRGKAQER